MFSCLYRRAIRLNKINLKFQRYLSKSILMANSRFEYVRTFETDDRILPNCWIVVRIDGKAFHKFTEKHNFVKPNDPNGKINFSSILFKINFS